MNKPEKKVLLSLVAGLTVVVVALVLDRLGFGLWQLPSGLSTAAFIGLLAGVWLLAPLLTLVTMGVLGRRGRRPDVEATMIGRLYRMISIVIMILAVAYGYGRLDTFGTLFSLFGGMLLGWSLQAPVSGFAAWFLVSIKRPFRPGDRIQLPNLGLTGDVKEIGPMYVVLDQVGGTVGSEEAVGRDILVPNAMLFSQVVINFTVRQEAAFMLDEIVVRVTYDSDLAAAERILLEAASAVTRDIITATGVEPYIRSDLYDYGIYLRLRYQTRVQERARIAYELNKWVVLAIQKTPHVDLAIPYVYSFRNVVRDQGELTADGPPAPPPPPPAKDASERG